MECSECGENIAYHTAPYDYTEDVSLDPEEYTVTIEETLLGRCGCGESVVIKEMSWLHVLIAREIGKIYPIRRSGRRYLRRHLGMTPQAFSELNQPLTSPDPLADGPIVITIPPL